MNQEEKGFKNEADLTEDGSGLRPPLPSTSSSYDETVLKKPRWKFSLSDSEEECNIWFQVFKSPNMFNRFMQRLFFGIIWKKM